MVQTKREDDLVVYFSNESGHIMIDNNSRGNEIRVYSCVYAAFYVADFICGNKPSFWNITRRSTGEIITPPNAYTIKYKTSFNLDACNKIYGVQLKEWSVLRLLEFSKRGKLETLFIREFLEAIGSK